MRKRQSPLASGVEKHFLDVTGQCVTPPVLPQHTKMPPHLQGCSSPWESGPTISDSDLPKPHYPTATHLAPTRIPGTPTSDWPLCLEALLAWALDGQIHLLFQEGTKSPPSRPMLGAHTFQPGLLWSQSHTQGLIPHTHTPISPPPLLSWLHPALDRFQNDGTEQALGKYLLDGLLDGCMVGWMDRCWTDGWMDGWKGR